MTKDQLKFIRHSRLIVDPFPEHSEYEYFKSMQSKVKRFFNLKTGLPKPKQISIWEAYRMGYDKAYSEIEERFPEKE